MTIWMWLFIIAIICQRLIELVIAKHNEQWMKERGGVEQGETHYKWMVLLHVIFFLSLLTEAHLQTANISFHLGLFLIFLIAQLGRVWCITSLGKFWNTKIIVLPNVALITRGPYKWVKHPNYIIVGIEMFVIPLLVGAYWTAFLFPILHVLLLKIRVPEEERALRKAGVPD
ncbi:hypothetical protein DX933_10490 [Ornithinibacillus gellani]|uniref:isoprenylcysteine carboxyl methyltransferase family protein n=1 Tax=Ornithinibacillus gellani TaxID=2293253 RepID=UPI000F4A6F31|nr:isoprenylcysteine carboxylmethyltransferase family protein [Ornithinibacillus gellani]TQS74373.1 hypothetical protein DX933_10490 [Ornithinibacillus gellani]